MAVLQVTIIGSIVGIIGGGDMPWVIQNGGWG